jgi:curved DNA-binding protein
MNPKNYYQILQVDPSASAEVIEVAYHRLARMYHPDVNREQGAIQQMQQLNEAYGLLRNPIRRAQYDQSLHTRSVTDPQCK